MAILGMGKSTRQQDDRYLPVLPMWTLHSLVMLFLWKSLCRGCGGWSMVEMRCWPCRLEAQSGEWLTGWEAGKQWPPSQKQATENRNLETQVGVPGEPLHSPRSLDGQGRCSASSVDSSASVQG